MRNKEHKHLKTGRKPPHYWLDFESWQEYGLSNDYTSRNPSSLEFSDDSKERSWHKRGERKKWLTKFDFQRKYSVNERVDHSESQELISLLEIYIGGNGK